MAHTHSNEQEQILIVQYLVTVVIISGTYLPYFMAYFVCDNVSMYLKTHQRKKNDKVIEYYSLVEI